MLHSEAIVISSENHTKHINALCGQNIEFYTVKREEFKVTTNL
jgi:hypothetical protein